MSKIVTIEVGKRYKFCITKHIQITVNRTIDENNITYYYSCYDDVYNNIIEKPHINSAHEELFFIGTVTRIIPNNRAMLTKNNRAMLTKIYLRDIEYL